jgi:hypothetical protein
LPWTSLQILAVWSWIVPSSVSVFWRSIPVKAETGSLRP